MPQQKFTWGAKDFLLVYEVENIKKQVKPNLCVEINSFFIVPFEKKQYASLQEALDALYLLLDNTWN